MVALNQHNHGPDSGAFGPAKGGGHTDRDYVSIYELDC